MDLTTIVGSRNLLGATSPMGLWEEFHQEGNKIEVIFQPFLMADIMASEKVVYNEPDQMPS